MALKVTFDEQASLREQMAVVERIRQDVIKSQSIAGEKFVTDCRDQVQDHSLGTYVDDTANLRHSIGYFIRIDGVIEMENTNATGEAKEAVLAAINDIPVVDGIQLIGLAGMNYASHVESKGYNVMSVQADVALVDLSDLYKEIENKYK